VKAVTISSLSEFTTIKIPCYLTVEIPQQEIYSTIIAQDVIEK
jgi:hypothetical protein